MKALLIDDELPAQRVLKKLLEENCPEVSVSACVSSAAEARAFLNDHKIDILFLDVSMPMENGFDLLHTIDQFNYAVVFVTGNQEHALKALKASAVDFLLKPVDIDELKDAVKKIGVFQNMRKQNRNLNTDYINSITDLSQNLQAQLPITKLTLHHLQGFKIISIPDIIYLEADGNYTVFNMANREKIVVSKQMGMYEELLDKNYFFRTHKSFIVNLKHLKEFSSVDGYFAIMHDDISVLISRRRVDEFLQMVKTFSLTH